MDALIFIAAIAYLILGAVNKNKKAREKAEADAVRRQKAMRAAEAPDGAPSLSDASKPAASSAPIKKPQPVQQAAFRQPAPLEAKPVPAARVDTAMQSRNADPIQTRTREAIRTQLTQITESHRHTLEASSLTGHAHEESSISGIQADCATEAQRYAVEPERAAVPGVQAGTSGFSLPLNAASMRRALLYTEILGKPKALRQGR